MIVVDASAWVDVLIGSVLIPELAEDRLSVPPHFDAEVLGSIRALNQRGRLADIVADVAMQRHMRAPFDRVFEPGDMARDWTYRASMSFSDAWYVAIAERLNAWWFASDAKAARAAPRHVTVRIVTAERS